MRRPALFLFVLLGLMRFAMAQDSSPSQTEQSALKLTPPPTRSAASSNAHPAANGAAVAVLQATVDQLTRKNDDLLDLLKKQQGVLEDIEYDRRLQSRQIQSLEERLEDALLQNTKLQDKVSNLEAAAAVAPVAAPVADKPVVAPPTPPPGDAEPAAPPTPSTYLPPAQTGGDPTAPAWHRLFTLSGTDNKDTDLFHIQGSAWRIFWHNLDKPGKTYANTSALFINAYPKDDTIPQKVCSKLGTGGDCTELAGPGNYYLKVEASGGSWELAVEDFH